MTAQEPDQPTAPPTPPGRHRHVWWVHTGAGISGDLARATRWTLDRDGRLRADGRCVSDDDMRRLGFVRCTCTRPGDRHEPGCSAAGTSR